MSYLEEILSEVEEMTPKTGFNVCTFDDFARNGEKLTLEGHFEVENQANKLKEKLEKDGQTVYIYPAESLQESVKLGKPFEDKSDTGDDLTRTGPGGNLPKDDYDMINYHSNTDAQFNLKPTPISDGHDVYNVPGDVINLKSYEKTFEINEAVEPREKSFQQPSSFVGKVTYTPESQSMEVDLNGKTYHFCRVPEKTFDEFQGAPSKGAFFSRFVKQQFNCMNGLKEALRVEERDPDEFSWISESMFERIKKFKDEYPEGRILLVVASGDTYTDHRIEGREKHRRHWTKEESIQNIRTARGKLLDIDHMYQKKNPESGYIADANWNFKTDKGEMIILETDQEILDAIRKNIITAVSINTGEPREMPLNCDTGECFLEPKGIVLGEKNNIALSYIVTDPAGFYYNGQYIPPMPPGMKFTKIYLIE